MDNFLKNLRGTYDTINNVQTKANPMYLMNPSSLWNPITGATNRALTVYDIIKGLIGGGNNTDNAGNAANNVQTTDVNAEAPAATATAPTAENAPNAGGEQTDTAKDKFEPSTTQNNSGTIQYKYKKGDTFGQVLLDLGLSKPGQLWGSDGDVAYYTEQLRKQGITGNVPIGTVITLTPRENLKNEILDNWAKNASKGSGAAK